MRQMFWSPALPFIFSFTVLVCSLLAYRAKRNIGWLCIIIFGSLRSIGYLLSLILLFKEWPRRVIIFGWIFIIPASLFLLGGLIILALQEIKKNKDLT